MKKVLAGIVAALVVVSLGWAHRDQITARFSCAEKVAHQFTTTKVVNGAWDCIPPDTKDALSILVGVDTATKFAEFEGLDGATYTYLGETNDGGYTYRFDYIAVSHNPYKKAWDDLVSGNFKEIWPELNGETQGWISFVRTFYLYPQGTTLTNLKTGEVFDISGEISALK